MSESLSTRKMVLWICVACCVTAVVVSLFFGAFLNKFNKQQIVTLQAAANPNSAPAPEQVTTLIADKSVAVSVPQTDMQQIELKTTIQHRFSKGDYLRHVTGIEEYDVEVTGVNRYLMEDGSVSVSYDLDFKHWIYSLNGYEKLPAPFVDASYNKR